MKKLLGLAFGYLKGESSWLVLLAVAGVGAWLYVNLMQARSERDGLQHWAEVTCAASGAAFPASTSFENSSAGKLVVVRHDQGVLCRTRVADLASFKAQSAERTAELLAQALKDHDTRAGVDSAAARRAAEAANQAALRMETADADAERTNLVDREWFAAVNGVAGLRAPSR